MQSSPSELVRFELQALAAERQWLFDNIFPRALTPIREGLQECSDLLHNANITLPISSRETECLKGIITRQGAQITKGELLVKLNRLHLRLSVPAGKQIHLQQIEDVNSLVHYSIESLQHDLYQDTADRIVKDVLCNLNQALDALAKCPVSATFPLGTFDSDTLSPELPPNVALDLYIQDASLVSEVRTLQPREADGFFSNIRKNAQVETGGFVRFRGRDVKVIDHVRVDSQDPALIAISTKLMALKHNLEEVQKKLIITQAIT